MSSGIDSLMMRLRIESKIVENKNKPVIVSSDIAQTADFLFSQKIKHDGDSGKLLLAKQKTNRNNQYLVKHEYTDCACNEFVYTKLAQGMGYCMPDAVLFQLSPGEKRSCFKTEYIIGERYLNVIDPAPSYEKIRSQAKNWKQYFAFYGLYSLTGEADGVELLLADDDNIYRVDTADAFHISNYQLDTAGINQELGGINPHNVLRKQLLTCDMSQALNRTWCDIHLKSCLEVSPDGLSCFLEPFSRLQDVRADYVDCFLNILCYFYPDFIGDYFKRYLSALQKQCWDYYKEKRDCITCF